MPLLEAAQPSLTREQFSQRLLHWYREHGRHDLPWQQAGAYGIWVSEIMLQQTQVATVIPYYERFMDRFPDVASLAAAPLDEVLHHWSGLGYYARARHLHEAAQRIRDRHGGHFPDDFDAVLALPGIGRSTAGAILALAHGQRHAILDGNVKRVLARVFAVDGWPGTSRVAKTLWGHAERLTPQTDVAAYTQAIMDLGATVCVRGKPHCVECPLRPGCQAYASGNPVRYPGRRPRAAERTTRQARLLLVRSPAGVLLERRPAAGIWGGLWSLPELLEKQSATQWCRERFCVPACAERELEELNHSFTHFDLTITPVVAHLETTPASVFDEDRFLWYNSAAPASVGLPAPIRTLIGEFDRL